MCPDEFLSHRRQSTAVSMLFMGYVSVVVLWLLHVTSSAVQWTRSSVHQVIIITICFQRLAPSPQTADGIKGKGKRKCGPRRDTVGSLVMTRCGAAPSKEEIDSKDEQSSEQRNWVVCGWHSSIDAFKGKKGRMSRRRGSTTYWALPPSTLAWTSGRCSLNNCQTLVQWPSCRLRLGPSPFLLDWDATTTRSLRG